MRYKQQKETLIGKLIAAIAWVMMIILLGISSLYAVVEDMSVEGLLAAGASIAAATLAFLGLQVLASVVDDGLTSRKKAQKKEPASAAAPEQTMNQAVSAPDHPASAKTAPGPRPSRYSLPPQGSLITAPRSWNGRAPITGISVWTFTAAPSHASSSDSRASTATITSMRTGITDGISSRAEKTGPSFPQKTIATKSAYAKT